MSPKNDFNNFSTNNNDNVVNQEKYEKIITKISNYALKKSQNVADIPNKNVLVKNRSLLEKLIPVGVPPP
ncbi:hypothetical protein [Photorhabdus caribbeanensis]|uniref:hypothetical protein n=1 Tax=Photorhabdus caribbeanensis TaxID=1004165 RepID=UPI001FE9CF49|nr:hypothetical protein [Photorhabdus caribbeanensis]